MQPQPSPETRISSWLEEINHSRSWLPLGAFLLILLFTPLGTLWWLCLLVIAGLFFAQRLKSSTAILWAMVALAGGILTAGAWNPRTLAPALRGDLGDLQTIDWSGVQRLEIRGFNGNLRLQVKASGGDLRLERKGGASVTLEKNGDLLRLSSRRPFFSFSSGVNMTLDIPANLQINLQTSNGSIRLDGAVRDLIATTSNGRIEIRDTGTTKAVLQTSNAEISAERVAGFWQAKSSNGKIRFLQSTDLRLALETSNADVKLENLALQNNTESKVTTSNGAIQLESIQASSGLTIRGATSNAPLSVNLPNFAVQLEEYRFEARKEGFGMALLELQTSNQQITVR